MRRGDLGLLVERGGEGGVERGGEGGGVEWGGEGGRGGAGAGGGRLVAIINVPGRGHVVVRRSREQGVGERGRTRVAREGVGLAGLTLCRVVQRSPRALLDVHQPLLPLYVQ